MADSPSSNRKRGSGEHPAVIGFHAAMQKARTEEVQGLRDTRERVNRRIEATRKSLPIPREE